MDKASRKQPQLAAFVKDRSPPTATYDDGALSTAAVSTTLGALLRRPCERLAAYARAARQLRLRGVGDETVCRAIEQTLTEACPNDDDRRELSGAPRVLNFLCALVDAQQAQAMSEAVPAALVVSAPRNMKKVTPGLSLPPAVPQSDAPLPSPRALAAVGKTPPLPASKPPRPSSTRPTTTRRGNSSPMLARERSSEVLTADGERADSSDDKPAAPPPHREPAVPRIPSTRPEVCQSFSFYRLTILIYWRLCSDHQLERISAIFAAPVNSRWTDDPRHLDSHHHDNHRRRRARQT